MTTTSAIVHFPANGRNRASAALTVATTSSRSCAAATIRALIDAAFSSIARLVLNRIGRPLWSINVHYLTWICGGG